MKVRGEPHQPPTLNLLDKVDSCLFESIVRRAQCGILQIPKPEKSSFRPVGRRKKDVGVEEQPIHCSAPPVRNRVRIDTELLYLFSGSAVIRIRSSRGEEKLRFA